MKSSIAAIFKQSFIFISVPLFHIVWFNLYTKSDSVPGNGDIFYNLAAYEWVWNYIKCGFINNEGYRTFCFPVDQVKWLLGTDIWLGIVFVILKSILLNPIVCVNVFIATIMAMNSIGTYFLIRPFVSKPRLLYPLVLLLPYLPLYSSMLDTPNSIFFLPSALVLSNSLKFLQTNNTRFLWVMALSNITQFYFNAYFGFFSLLYLVALFIYKRRVLVKNTKTVFFISIAILIGLYPFIQNFLLTASHNGVNQISLTFSNDILSHNFKTLTTYSSDSFLSEFFSKENSSTGNYDVFPGFTGLALVVMFLLFSSHKYKKEIFLLFIFFLICSLGYYKETNIGRVPLLLGLADYFFPLHDFVRIPVKAFNFAGLFLIIMIASALNEIWEKFKNGSCVVFLGILMLIEQFPFFPNIHHNGSDLNMPQVLADNKKILSGSVVFFYPSTIFYPPAEVDYRYDRTEYLYMLWGANLNVNLINGLTSAKIPNQRVKLNSTLLSGDYESANELLLNHGINYLILCEKFLANSTHKKMYENFANYYAQKLIINSDGIRVYKLR